jgi:hypothetical protein
MKESQSIEISRRQLFTVAGLSAGAALLPPSALLSEGIRSFPSTAKQQNCQQLSREQTCRSPL